MRSLIIAATFALANLLTVAQAADGELDPTFGTDAENPGYGFYFNPNALAFGNRDGLGAIVERPDKKIWAVGRMRAPGAYRLSLYLLEADGYPDVAFGDLGLRTVVGPCSDFDVADAKLDAQNRLLVTTDGCADFKVYRFLPNGDLDASFAAGGVLSVDFNQGGSNNDSSKKLAIAMNGDILIAGTVATATSGVLGVARFTDTGQPAPGFGVAGKLQVPFEWQVRDISGVNGLHLMDDGRIVIAGMISKTAQADSDAKQYVVRTLANGLLDPSFGNSAAGISTTNLKPVLGVAASPDTYASIMERDGSVIQVGRVLSNNPISNVDVLLLRWRADGQPDTNVGPGGTRTYALDFAGPNPVDPVFNNEYANAIARQDNGDYVIAGRSLMASAGDFASGVMLMRLKSNFNLDTRFGDNGRVNYLIELSIESNHGLYGNSLLLQKGRILLGGGVVDLPLSQMQMVMGLEHDEIFAHTFD